jgi:manganese efflux pump family protein
MLALLLVAVSVGLGNFGATTALGVSGVDRRLRIQIAVIFGIFEGGMPVVGLVIGHSVAHELGGSAPVIGGTLLGLTGAYSVLRELLGEKRRDNEGHRPSLVSLIALGAALSIDNLVIGFALGTYHANLAAAIVTIALVSTTLSLLGLELGSRLGTKLGGRSELVGGAVLIAVGIAVGTGAI